MPPSVLIRLLAAFGIAAPDVGKSVALSADGRVSTLQRWEVFVALDDGI